MIAVPAGVLAELEACVEHALRTGDESALSVLGYGEISCVLALDVGGAKLACKRVPPFDSAARLEAYTTLLGEYLDALRAASVEPLETELMTTPAADGRTVAYVVQPRFEPAALVSRHIGAQPRDQAVRRFLSVVDAACRVTRSGRVGIDEQLANWCVLDDQLFYIDVTTPLLRDAAGRDRLDLDLFLAALPWAMRGLVRRFMARSIADRFFTPRLLVLDLLGNLYKEKLAELVPPFLEALKGRFDRDITEKEVRRFYASDAKLWARLLTARRLDRWWQRHIRRRTYPFLLPGPISR